MTSPDHAARLATLTSHELLAMHIAVQTELERRGIPRTAAITGDLGEHIALRIYGGTLAPAGTKAYDLTDPEGRRVQVKTRVSNRSEGHLKVSLKTSLKTVDGFDACLVLLLDQESLRPLMAREVSREGIAVMKMLKQSLHVSDFRTAGLAVLIYASDAWRALDLEGKPRI